MSVRQAPVSFYEKGKQMKKGEILEGVVKELRFPNKGILEIEGAPVVVKNAVPGQKIRFSVMSAALSRRSSGSYSSGVQTRIFLIL